MRRVLGIDIGGVIIDRRNDRTPHSMFGPNYLEAPEMAGAFDTIGELRSQFDNVVIVSKCGVDIQRRTREWLEHHRFYDRTGMSHNNVHFCLERKGKAPICRELGVTDFIDDRLEVLSYLDFVPQRYLFRPREEEVRRYAELYPHVTRVESWDEVLARVPDTFPSNM